MNRWRNDRALPHLNLHGFQILLTSFSPTLATRSPQSITTRSSTSSSEKRQPKRPKSELLSRCLKLSTIPPQAAEVQFEDDHSSTKDALGKRSCHLRLQSVLSISRPAMIFVSLALRCSTCPSVEEPSATKRHGVLQGSRCY
ncbi:uncharacterized protein K460DRAFT_82473 [Cucurbitaria berberidis CBS 394.84]|uniref:Uncharacterized protein n=1 Tax=Cucurbitaria berberidis CBS 394.84 TaxID=1168544 RepID=A0A9P4LC13_9PLEO|nr:uncharacterized protein K460DRAFT_82473 [Cucurbitaria berberidis CBS 394.84]KAF1848902.1 hypothetical protein K460DRAFT_82473 [Cucurbitaria berberidis CBS 394.84]